MKLEEIINEAQAMRTANHDNILSLYTSFVHQNDLWMVEPFVSGGSVLNVMKFCHPNGLDEPQVRCPHLTSPFIPYPTPPCATASPSGHSHPPTTAQEFPQIAAIMKEVLKGLDYMHRNSLIHRDIKAGNILLDRESGAVKLADFGVVATLERRGSWGHDAVGRQTMCGTPCWMAPEVLLAEQGAVDMYKSAADIWSVGITLFEMAHGHAPFSKVGSRSCRVAGLRAQPSSPVSMRRGTAAGRHLSPQLAPMHVFMKIVRDEPPSLESGDAGDPKKSFSKGFKDVVAQVTRSA